MRAERPREAQRKIDVPAAAHDTTGQIYSVAAACCTETRAATHLRQLNQVVRLDAAVRRAERRAARPVRATTTSYPGRPRVELIGAPPRKGGSCS